MGGALTDLLNAQTLHSVRVYDDLLYEESYLKQKPFLDFVRGDVRDGLKLKEQLKWADVVVWLAAIVGDGACAINPDLTTEVNQKSVRWLSENFDKRIIFMSTCSVYGAHDKLLYEGSEVNPLSVYASTKLQAESYLQDKNAVIFRLGTLFGLGDQYSRIRLDLVVNTMTARAISEGKLKVFGGKQYRPLLHVKDAAQAIIDNLQTSNTGIYNLHHTNIQILDLANQVREKIPVIIELTEIPFEDQRNYRVSSQKAIDTFNFEPAHSVSEGIEEVAKLIRNGRIKDINNPRYTNVGYLEVFNAN